MTVMKLVSVIGLLVSVPLASALSEQSGVYPEILSPAGREETPETLEIASLVMPKLREEDNAIVANFESKHPYVMHLPPEYALVAIDLFQNRKPRFQHPAKSQSVMARAIFGDLFNMLPDAFKMQNNIASQWEKLRTKDGRLPLINPRTVEYLAQYWTDHPQYMSKYMPVKFGDVSDQNRNVLGWDAHPELMRMTLGQPVAAPKPKVPIPAPRRIRLRG